MGVSSGTDTLANGVVSEFFTDDPGATRIFVQVDSGTALISVPGLHVSGDFVTIETGQEVEFRLNFMGLKHASGKGSGGDADITFGVISRTVDSGR